jgi:hypothetical protein
MLTQAHIQAAIDDLRAKGFVPKVTKRSGQGAPLDPNFDFDEFCEHFQIEILRETSAGRYDIECPLKRDRHAGGASVTSLFYDGETLGFKCLHPDHEEYTIAKLVSELSGECSEYEEPLFEEWDWDDSPIPCEDCSITPEELKAMEEEEKRVALAAMASDEPAVQSMLVTASPSVAVQQADIVGAVASKNFSQDLLELACWGRVGRIAKESNKPLGWMLLAILCCVAARGIKVWDEFPQGKRKSKTIPVLYVATIGMSESGKTEVHEHAKEALGLSASECENITISSDRGLINLLAGDKKHPKPQGRAFLAFIAELGELFRKAEIMGSTLSFKLNDLWDDGKMSGVVDKFTNQSEITGYMSINGGLAIKDTTDFSKYFGAQSQAGSWGRFLFAEAEKELSFDVVWVEAERLDYPEVIIEKRFYDIATQFKRSLPDQEAAMRMGQHVLRLAVLYQALESAGHKECVTEDVWDGLYEEVVGIPREKPLIQQVSSVKMPPSVKLTDEAFSAARSLCLYCYETKKRFRAGMAENQSAVATNAVLDAMKDFTRKREGKPFTLSMLGRWYHLYRKFGADTIQRVVKALAEGGIIEYDSPFRKDKDGNAGSGTIRLLKIPE